MEIIPNKIDEVRAYINICDDEQIQQFVCYDKQNHLTFKKHKGGNDEFYLKNDIEEIITLGQITETDTGYALMPDVHLFDKCVWLPDFEDWISIFNTLHKKDLLLIKNLIPILDWFNQEYSNSSSENTSILEAIALYHFYLCNK